MNYRQLGYTGLRVSEISFGAGPVPGLMITSAKVALQSDTVRRALDAGVNWFDTAATYGDGQSESGLGAALRAAGADQSVHLATKVRLMPEHLGDIKENVKESIRGSLRRLGRERITLLQLHNSITRERGDQPTSITSLDVLGKGGVLEAFAELQSDGVIEHFGLTGLGDLQALRETVVEGPWAGIQLCIDILHPLPELLFTCKERGIGVIAIRVLAGGALAGQGPSAHTLKTKFFPIAIFEEDQKNAAELARSLPKDVDLKSAAIRFVLSQDEVTTALIGFATTAQVDEAVGYAQCGPLPKAWLQTLSAAASA